MKIGDADTWRKSHLAVAEWIDAWRLIPRLLVGAYSYLVWMVVNWFMDIKPEILEGCDFELLKEVCIVHAPTNQHTAFVSAVVGIAAAVFGLYVSSGRKWSEFTPWNSKKTPPKAEGASD